MRTSFDLRLRERAILAAARLLELRVTEGIADAQRHELEQRLAEAQDAAKAEARNRIGRLRQSLTTIGYLDLDSATTLPGDLGWLANVGQALSARPDGDAAALPARNRIRVPDVPPDFPELHALLAEMEARRDHMRQRIAERQRADLTNIAAGRAVGGSEDPVNASVAGLLAAFDRLDPVTVDDALAELRAGRPVAMPGPEAPDPFERFFPEFVSRIESAADTTARGRIIQALTEGAAAGPLALDQLSEVKSRRLLQLAETWGSADNAMRQSQPGRLREALARLLGQVGLSGVQVSDLREAIPGRMRLFNLRCDVPRPSGWFLPPAFGSAALGNYALLVARSEVTIDQILRQIASEAPDSAWIVVFLGRLGVQDRRRLARQVHGDGRQALFLDEGLLLFAGIEGEDPLEGIFRGGLPFAFVQPYSTNPGQIPPEVFFGRRGEIDRIIAREGGGCLIYGGRQLGKSALLNHIRGERHRPERGELAIYLDIKPIGGPGQAAGSLWEELAHLLRRHAGFEKVEASPNALVDAIERWLLDEPARRCLVMFDEADNFLRAEHAAGYPNLMKFKGLMERSGQRFKAVFAGLHNVRRMAQAPNSPLPHLGEPICIGPMNITPENRAALRRLALDPIRTAGLDYADPGLAADMLARMNYYPSLVQVFGRQIVESFGRRPAPGQDGPRWRLDRDSLFDGEAAARIAGQIRDRFQLTLNLDLRYDCIARSIALYRFEARAGAAQVLAAGLTADEIRDITHWPRKLPQPSSADFEELLSEMVDLGVLGRFPGNRFGLRNAQVAQMLGQREALEEDLLRLDEREEEPAYDATQFHRSLRPALPDARAPLPDRALERLFDTANPRVRIVYAPAAIAGADVARRLKAAADLWLKDGHHAVVPADSRKLGEAIEGARNGRNVIVIDGNWSADTARLLACKPKVAGGQVLAVWCVDRLPVDSADAVPFSSGAFSDVMLRYWLTDEGLAPALDDAETRAAILAASGGAPARLAALRPLLSDLAARPVANRVRELREWMQRTPLAPDALGLSDQDRACLKGRRDLDDPDLQQDDFAALCPEATDDRLERLTALGCLRRGTRQGHAPILTPLGMLAIA